MSKRRHLTVIKGGKDAPKAKETMEDVTEQELTPSEDTQPIVVIRLTTGEDVVTQIIGSDQNTITIVNPLIIALQDGEGGLGMRLVPFFMPYARGPITVNTGNVVALLREMDPQILDNYKRFFSPIIQPPSGIIA